MWYKVFRLNLNNNYKWYIIGNTATINKDQFIAVLFIIITY